MPTHTLPLLRLLCAAAAAPALAQDFERPVAHALRIETPPKIDGVLDEAVWSRAIPIGPLTQVEPHNGAVPTEATDVRILFDADYLYIGLRCFDSEPDRITARERARDADLEPDDRIEMVLDTFHDRRNAFFFQINPVGDKGDALISDNGQDFNKPWDGIWDARSTINAEGWCAEIAIPFKTLTFKPQLTTWGFNLFRKIKRKNEDIRWSDPRRDSSLFQISQAGELTGLEGLQQGAGLDVVPFFVGTWSKERVGDTDVDLIGHGGADAFYRLTPNLTASLTLNTDFAETEADERQINLTRFPLFFPEKRDFFLRDAGIFEFGGLGNDLVPFFSRRIGLTPTGEEQPILAGAKLTGRAGDYNIGALDVQTGDVDGFEGENLFVSRISKNIGELSSIGGIVTAGDPASSQGNVVYGLDTGFHTKSLPGGKTLNAAAWFLESDTEGDPGNDVAFGASVSYPNDLWDWELAAKEIESNFRAALGFVPRTGIRSYTGALFYKPRSSGEVRQYSFGVEADVITDVDDRLETFNGVVQVLGLEFESADEVRLAVVPQYERLDADFDITSSVTIPRGEYTFQRYRLEIETALKRAVATELVVEAGEFFDGTRTNVDINVEWRPGPLFQTGTEFEQNFVSLPDGDFTTQVARLRLDFAFTPDLSWKNFTQWDSESKSFGLNSRWRWIPVPGQEFFLVFNQTLEHEDDTTSPVFQELAFKASYTLRF